MKVITVISVSKDPTIRFAAEELVRYLNQMGTIAMLSSKGKGIVLGDYQALNIKTDIINPMDDEIYIDVMEQKGIISGPNPRSVLFSVYRYLTVCGCCFLHPTTSGERIPIKGSVSQCKIRERPSYRHRCISIEGANKFENVRDMIDWLPKVGMNSYHIQLKDGFTFYDRWYSHRYNPYKENEEISITSAEAYTEDIILEIRKRGLIFQSMGHGLTCEPFGIQGLGWDKEKLDLPETTMKYLAQINGKRQFWRDIPVNTNVCYSKPEVREVIIRFIIDYCEENPEVDMLHFWLADDYNNHCECENCIKNRPSDWYVMMLNELDEGLARKNNSIKIVFLIFYELLWPPVLEEINHPDRFILLFAPLSRKYTESFEVEKELPALPDFILNQIIEPESTEEDVAFLEAWKEIFPGDSFIFIYHLMTSGWEKDLTGYALAKTLHRDIQQFKSFGLNGVSSCQAQRVFFPTGLAMTVMVKSLWNDQLSFEDISKNYFNNAFGQDGSLVETFLATLSDLFDPVYLQLEKPRIDPVAIKRFASIPDYIHTFIPTIKNNLEHPDTCVRTNWRNLNIYCLLMEDCAGMFQELAAGEKEKVANETWPNFLAKFFEYEDALQSVFDIEWFARNFKKYQIEESGFTNY